MLEILFNIFQKLYFLRSSYRCIESIQIEFIVR